MSDNNWADNGEDDFFHIVTNQIEKNKQTREETINKAVSAINRILDRINVDFEPDPSYRNNVKNIIRGLVIYQLFKQRTISIFKPNKEDREYLGSFLMYKIQKYLVDNTKVTEWSNILTQVYNGYKKDIKFPDIENTVASKINLSKILPESVLESTLHNNKKEYIKRKGISPPVY